MTIQKSACIILLEHLFVIVYHERGLKFISENEMELLNMIRENDNPALALNAAVVIVLGYLGQHGSSEGQASADLQALG